MNLELYNKIYNKILPIYNEYKDHIISIYIAGSLICPVATIANNPRDIDLLIIVDNQETLDIFNRMASQGEILIDNYLQIDFRAWTKAGLKKYFKEELPETFEYQFHVLNNQEPLFGKKQKFNCRIDTDLQKYLDCLKSVRNEIWENCVEPGTEYIDKKYYKWLLGLYIVFNNSYTIFSPIQRQNLVLAHNQELRTAKFKELLVNWFDPILNSKYFDRRIQKQKEMDK